MGIISEELKLLDVFRKNLLKFLEFKEIMRLAKKKSRTWVFNVLQKFVDLDFIEKIKVNNSYLYKSKLGDYGLINFFHILDFAESQKKNTKWSKEIYDILSKIRINISKLTPFFVLLVFGSYAEGKQNNKSDLDLAIIIDSLEVSKRIKPYIEEIVGREIHEIDYHIIIKDDFKKMLLVEEENLGKEIFRKHILIWGGDQYYELIREAEKNGFKG